MLATLTDSSFEPHLNAVFTMSSGDQCVDVELIAVRRLGQGADAARDPFSVLFRGPAAPLLPQGIYTLSRAGFGACDLFVVAIGPDGTGLQYEAVFG